MFDIRDAIGGDVPKRARHILLSLGGDYKSENGEKKYFKVYMQKRIIRIQSNHNDETHA